MDCEAKPVSGSQPELQSGAQSADDVPFGPAPEPQTAGDAGSQPVSSPQTSPGTEVKVKPQPGKDVEVSDLLELYLQLERLCSENQYHCSTCGGLRDAERRLLLIKPPH